MGSDKSAIRNPQSAIGMRSARILVIEDNPTNLELMTYLLRAYKYEPIKAVTGEDGLELALSEGLDLVLCDIQLPNMDGFEVMRRIKAVPAKERLPIVAVTALAMVGDKERVIAAGFDGYIGKPITPENFVAQVERFLRPTPQAAPVDEATAARHAGARILIVDNTQANRDLVVSILRPAGYQLAVASSVSAALARARAITPDLIISDINMPGADGYALLANVKSNPALRHVPFVFSSATSWSEVERQKSLALGADGFLQQPLEPQALLDAVDKLLDQSRKTS